MAAVATSSAPMTSYWSGDIRAGYIRVSFNIDWFYQMLEDMNYELEFGEEEEMWRNELEGHITETVEEELSKVFTFSSNTAAHPIWEVLFNACAEFCDSHGIGLRHIDSDTDE